MIDHWGVVVKGGLNVGKCPVIHIDALHFRGDAIPAVEHPDGVHVGLQAGEDIRGGAGHQVDLGEIPAVFFHAVPHHGLFHWVLPGGVGAAFQPFGTVNPFSAQGEDAAGVVLDNGRHCGDRQGGVADEGGGDSVLGVDAELGFARGHQGGSSIFRGLDKLHLQAGFLIIAQGLGGVEAGVVGVGGPIQAEGDRSYILLWRRGPTVPVRGPPGTEAPACRPPGPPPAQLSNQRRWLKG